MSRHRALEPSNLQPEQSPRQSDGPDLLTQVQVCQRLGISDQTWMRWRKAGRTPVAVTLPSGRLKWRQQDIDRMTGTPQVVARRQFFGHARSLRVVSSERKGNTVARKSLAERA